MPEADALSKCLGVRGLALSSPACTVLGGVSEEHLGEGEEEFPRVVSVVVSVCCGVGEDVLAESCHDFGARRAALGWGVPCCGRGSQYVLPLRGPDGVVVGLGQVGRGVVGRAKLLMGVYVIGVGGEAALMGVGGVSTLLRRGL